MHLLNALLAWLPFLATAFAQAGSVTNTSREYLLKTDLKPNQPGKERFNNLYLEAYHIGAGLNDAVMVPQVSNAIKGFLNGTNGKSGDVTYQNQVFDLGNAFPWTMAMVSNANFYAAWEPVQVNAGGGADASNGNSGFWINGTGLQWTSELNQAPETVNEFGGWIVCDWWHGAPQLFFRIPFYSDPAPCSCADVYLCPEYI